MRKIVAIAALFALAAPAHAAETHWLSPVNAGGQDFYNLTAPTKTTNPVRVLDNPPAVANVTALEAVPGALYHDGSVIRVATVQADWVFHATSSATVDHITVASASGASGSRWIRSQTPSAFWYFQGPWYVGGAGASDENNCTASITPCATAGEIRRRLLGAAVPSTPITINLQGNLGDTDPLSVDVQPTTRNAGIGVTVLGVPSVTSLGTVASATAHNYATGVLPTITITSFDWTPWVGKVIRLVGTSGTTSKTAIVTHNLGSGVARITESNIGSAASTDLTTGNVLEGLTLPKAQGARANFVGTMTVNLVDFDPSSVGARFSATGASAITMVACTVKGASGMGFSAGTYNIKGSVFSTRPAVVAAGLINFDRSLLLNSVMTVGNGLLGRNEWQESVFVGTSGLLLNEGTHLRFHALGLYGLPASQAAVTMASHTDTVFTDYIFGTGNHATSKLLSIVDNGQARFGRGNTALSADVGIFATVAGVDVAFASFPYYPDQYGNQLLGDTATDLAAHLAVVGSDLCGFYPSTAVCSDAVTYAKMQNVSSASRIMCRGSASGAGDMQECTAGSGLSITGTVISASGTTVADADYGDITVSSSGAAWSIDPNVVSDAKLSDMTALSVKGRNVNTGGDPGDISAVAGSDCVYREGSSTIACGTVATNGLGANVVTAAKFEQLAGLSVFGRGSNSTGNGAAITGTADQVLRVSSAGTALGFGAIPESSVTNLVTDLAGKQATGNYITALTGDATAAGPGSAAMTLATVNASPGTYTNATVVVNGKGLATTVTSGATPLVDPGNNGSVYRTGSGVTSALNGTTGSVMFFGSTGVPAQDNANLFWDNSTKRLGIGTVAPQQTFHVVKDGAGAFIQVDSYSGGGLNRPILFMRSAQGSVASPTDEANSDLIGEFIGAGYAGGAFRNVAAVNLQVAPAGTISGSSLPSRIYFETTPNGSVTRTERMSIEPDGSVRIVGLGATNGGVMQSAVTSGQVSRNIIAPGLIPYGHATNGGLSTVAGMAFDPSGDGAFALSDDVDLAIYNLGGPGSSNYERVNASWSSNVFRLESQAGGTGTVRSMIVDASTATLSLSGDAGLVLASAAFTMTTEAGGTGNNVTLVGNNTDGILGVSSFESIGLSTTHNSSLSLDDSAVILGSPTIASAAPAVTKSAQIGGSVTITGTTTIPMFNVVTIAQGGYAKGDAGAVTVTNAASLYIEDRPAPGTDVTLTNRYSVWADGGVARFDGGSSNGLSGVFELPADATAGADVTIDGRVAIIVGGAVKYIRYYND